MNVSTSQLDQYTWVIQCSGRLTFQFRHEFKDAISLAEESSPNKIILDLAKLSFIDSAGLGLLSITHRKLSAKGCQLVITNAHSAVLDILLLTNMDKLFGLSDSTKTDSASS